MHEYMSSVSDADGYAVNLVCSVCGRPQRLCFGSGGGAEPDYAAIGRAVVSHVAGSNSAMVREATPVSLVAYIRRLQEQKDSLETSRALRLGQLMLSLLREVQTP